MTRLDQGHGAGVAVDLYLSGRSRSGGSPPRCRAPRGCRTRWRRWSCAQRPPTSVTTAEAMANSGVQAGVVMRPRAPRPAASGEVLGAGQHPGRSGDPACAGDRPLACSLLVLGGLRHHPSTYLQPPLRAASAGLRPALARQRTAFPTPPPGPPARQSRGRWAGARPAPPSRAAARTRHRACAMSRAATSRRPSHAASAASAARPVRRPPGVLAGPAPRPVPTQAPRKAALRAGSRRARIVCVLSSRRAGRAPASGADRCPVRGGRTSACPAAARGRRPAPG